ncbi:MAG: plsY, partial [Alphaproteobacteria bacterium]|nr:plsY [Alphaproteobacteria bacterium]
MILPVLLQALLLGYLLGTIPFGLFFAHLSGAGDIRKVGSGNIGATNVLR